MSGTYFKRATILVSDLERSLGIYRDILGFSVHYIKDSAPDSYSYSVFKIPKEAKIRFATLDSPDQVRTLGITEVKGISLPKPHPQPFMHCQVIQVADLPDVFNKIKALNLECTEMKIESNERQSFREQSFVDFDGHLVVLYEIIETK